MSFPLQTLINIVFFAASLQGVVLTILLFSIKSNIISNRLLGILTFLWAIILTLFASQSYGINIKFPHLLNTLNNLLFAWFPLLFLSVKYLITRYNRFKLMDLLHFLPMIISVILFTKFYLLSGEEKIELTRNPDNYYILVSFIFEEMLSIQGVVYSILTLILLHNYRLLIVEFHANVDKAILVGIRIGVILSLIAWILGILGTLFDRAEIDTGFDFFQFVYLFFVAIIYIISILALRSGEVYKLHSKESAELISIGLIDKKNDTNIVREIKTNIDANLALKEQELKDELNKRLLNYMETEKPYLNPDLNLQSLSDDLNVSRHQLSATINNKQLMNFFEFVNLYRVTTNWHMRPVSIPRQHFTEYSNR